VAASRLTSRAMVFSFGQADTIYFRAGDNK
jgi:hypothetical protein